MGGDKLYVALTVDVDPDNYDPRIFGEKGRSSWEGVDEGIPPLLARLDEIRDGDGRAPCFTWFVRADAELAVEFGRTTYLFDRYGPLWEERSRVGDEIGWHPHEKYLKDLIKTYNDLVKTGRTFRSARIGHALHSNEFMSQLVEWGFAADSTALPGRSRRGENPFDWSSTPPQPYFPSIDDYRLPARDPGGLVEIPFTMVLTRASYDKRPLQRYLNLSFKPVAFVEPIKTVCGQKELVVCILHPSELLADGRDHPLLTFSLDVVTTNLRAIIDGATAAGKKVVYVTVGEVADLVREKAIVYENV